MTPHRSLASSVAVVALLTLLVAPRAAPAADWDQDSVAELAGDLAEAAADLRRSLRRKPPQSLASAQEQKSSSKNMPKLPPESSNSSAFS